MKIELTEQQLKTLIELINNSQFIGSSAEFIVELKQALQKTEEARNDNIRS